MPFFSFDARQPGGFTAVKLSLSPVLLARAAGDRYITRPAQIPRGDTGTGL